MAEYQMRRGLLTFFVCGMVFVTVACGRKQGGTGNTDKLQGQATTSAVSVGGVQGGNLAEQSTQYAEQIVSGLMERVWEHFTDRLAEQMPLYNLQASWDGVMAGAKGYQGIERVEEGESDGRQSVLVVLRYAGGQGRTIQFIYDTSGEIAGIWFDTMQLEGAEVSGAALSGTSDYEEREIIVGRDPYPLDGILTRPMGRADCPVVILLGDGTDLDMDGTVGEAGNHPLQDLARGLAAREIASLRYHMRGYQYSGELSRDSSVYDLLLEDVGYAVTRLYNEAGVDRQQIYVVAMGSSGEYVPAMVADKPKRIAGAVLMGVKPVSFRQSFYSEKEEKKKSVNSDALYFIKENSTFPLLMMQGEADCDTSMEDFEQWKVLWKGRSHITYRTFHQLNHYFMRSMGSGDPRDYDVEGEVSPEVVQTIADWIKERED